MSKNQVKVIFYGVFRKYGKETILSFQENEEFKIFQLRRKLESWLKSQFDFRDSEILNSSVFGNETQILSENAEIKMGSELVILPPVCGG